MNRETQRALNAINRAFYTDEASSADFSKTRDHPWRGWERMWRAAERVAGAKASTPLTVLDVGCGNGRFAAFLAAQKPERIHYTGIDTSPRLLERAAERAEPLAQATFICRDVLEPDLEATGERPAPAEAPRRFDVIVAFGLLHHIPGLETRRAFLQQLANQLAPNGILAFTLWRFAEASLWPRFQSRDIDWDDYNRAAAHHPDLPRLDPSQREPGDHLLRWGDVDGPARYCHYCDESERDSLLESLPLKRIDHYSEDGRSKDLNEYLILQRSDPSAGAP